jgi:hypothetical protein
MWIPTPIYERIPRFYILAGLLFLSSCFYLGFDFRLTYVYLGTGIFCFIWGLRILARRLSHREASPEEQGRLQR